MHRTLALLSLTVVFLASAGLTQATPPVTDLNRSLADHQRRQAAHDQQLRDGIDSLEKLQAYQRQVRENWLQILGEWPERTPLEPQRVGRLEREGYVVEKILLQSQPGFYVTVNLYLPTGGQGPCPAVLSPLGHAPLGKAHHTQDNYQAMFISLARQGYVVCTWDPLGQGEREPYNQPTGNHHVIQGYQCFPSGRHLCQYFLWDGIRCLDYLLTRPEVDPQHVACAGCSGGGALTQYLAAIDERITLAVPTSWISDSPLLTVDAGLHTESWFPGLCDPQGPGTRQLLACIAPRPLLILGNDDDAEFPPASMREVAQDAAALYRRLGVAERFDYVSVPTPHGFWPPARQELYRFLSRHIRGEAAGFDEGEVATEPVENLQCAPQGQVRHIPGSKTVYDLNQSLQRALADLRRDRRRELSASAYRSLIRNGVVHSLRLSVDHFAEPGFTPAWHAAGTGESPDGRVLEYLPGFFTAVDVFSPQADGPTVLLLADDPAAGRQRATELARLGFRSVLVQGDQTDDRREILSGSPRTGRWSLLLLQAASALRRDTAALSARTQACILWGEGATAARAVQCAALVEPAHVAAIVTLQGLHRIEACSAGIADSHRQQMLPGALRWFDESDLTAALAPLPQWIGDLRAPRGEHLLPETQQTTVEWGRTCYAFQGMHDKLEFRPETPPLEEIAAWIRRQIDLPPPSEATVIGSRRELFVDHALIERLTGSAELRLQAPTPREIALTHDAPWEGNATAYHSIVHDAGRYRLYYRAGNLALSGGQLMPGPESLCYAESVDGVRFERPPLGLHEFAGSKANNLVLTGSQPGAWNGLGAPGIFRDDNPLAPASARYKSLITTRQPLGLQPIESADGLHWTSRASGPTITRGAFDSQNVVFWDGERGEYRAYWRIYTSGTTDATTWQPAGVRAIRTAVSSDLVTWRDVADLTYVDSPEEELYENGIAPYHRAPHLFLGFPVRYVDRAGAPSTSPPDGSDRAGTERTRAWPPALRKLPDLASREERAAISERFGTALTETLFMASRDGVRFQRWDDAFIRPGIERSGTWNYGQNFVAWGLVETASSLPGAPPELSLYATEGYWTSPATALRRYTLRLDGFVSAHAGRRGGELLTRPVIFSGNTLSLNFSTSAAGSVRVELQSADGVPRPGYSLGECDELFGDSLDRTVTWRGTSDLSREEHLPVRLRFVLSDADLYSYRFQPESKRKSASD